MRTLTPRRLAMAAVVLALGALAAGEPRPPGQDLMALAAEIEAERDHVSAPELAQWIRRGEPGLRIFDLRARAEYDELHVAGAEWVTLEGLLRLSLPGDAKVVLYSEGGAHSAQAWLLLRARGVRAVWFLREGMYEWIARVLEPRLPRDPSPAEQAEYDVALPLSRYFGGVPRRDVPRAQVPTGYWTGSETRATTPRVAEAVGRIRRRGC